MFLSQSKFFVASIYMSRGFAPALPNFVFSNDFSFKLFFFNLSIS
jgi:hypothetical protein